MLTSDINALGVLRILEALRQVNPDAKFYQTSTSEMFGKVQETHQKETTAFYPKSPYGVAKLFAHWITISYRESYGMYTCSGILFNHEFPLRSTEFITRQLSNAIAKISLGLQEKVIVGNLEAKRDWGFAKEYVQGMWQMLQLEQPDDFVLATGHTHSVREFIESAFRAVGTQLVWGGTAMNTVGRYRKTGEERVVVSPEFYRPAEVDLLLGNSSKAKEKLGWEPKVGFEQLINMMVEADLRRLKNKYR